MKTRWNEKQESWLGRTTLSEDISKWALEAVNSSKKEIQQLEELIEKKSSKGKNTIEIEHRLKEIRLAIKNEISKKESGLNEIILNASNSSKLQVSVPANLNYLMKLWAAAEGRDLSSVAFQCLEIGLRLMKSKGSIPLSAVERYDIACEKRIALSEASSIWNEHEEFYLKN
tara:strand:+ start:2697 stop:3212 length:516 start_codon:yes stop_codon:yes gene_type:complete